MFSQLTEYQQEVIAEYDIESIGARVLVAGASLAAAHVEIERVYSLNPDAEPVVITDDTDRTLWYVAATDAATAAFHEQYEAAFAGVAAEDRNIVEHAVAIWKTGKES